MHDHARLQSILEALDAFSDEAAEPWSAKTRLWIDEAVRTYSMVLGRHIAKEEKIFFPWAVGRLSRDVKLEIDAQLAPLGP